MLSSKRLGDERQLGDERILGRGHFVEQILKGQAQPQPPKSGNLDNIVEQACEQMGVLPEQMFGRTRTRKVCRARRMFFLRGHEETGESMASLGGLCGLAHTSVREAIAKARRDR